MIDKDKLIHYLKSHAECSEKENNFEYELAMRRCLYELRTGRFDLEKKKDD
jgi:hypothetical protein